MEELIDKAANTLFPAIIGGVIVSGFILTALKLWLGGIVAKNDKLADRVDDLENTRVVKLEDAIADHIKEDSSAEIMTELRYINGSINKLTDKVDRFSEASAKQQAEIVASHSYIENLDKSLQRHKEAKHAT